MDKSYILFLIIFFTIQGKAQDILITSEGNVKTVYNVEVSNKAVFYKLSKEVSAPIQRIDKSKILMIKHHDGTKEIFDVSNKKETINNNVPSVNSTPPVSQQVTSSVTVTLPDEEIAKLKAENEKAMTAYNKGLVSFNDEKMKAKKKKTDFCYYLFNLKSNSIIDDANVLAIYAFNGIKEWNTEYPNVDKQIMSVSIYNKTDKIIYIDLGNTFITSMKGSRPYYIPSSTSHTNGKESGGSINIGSIAGALGVGGAIGKVANGVNVGGGTSNSSTTTTFSQRVIAIPPHTSKSLDDNTFDFGYNDKMLKIGEVQIYDENNSPRISNVSSYISYSFDENCLNMNHLEAYFYLKEAIGIKCKFAVTNALLSLKYFAHWIPHLEDLSGDCADMLHCINLNVSSR